MVMPEKVRTQILLVKKTGAVNMLAVNSVKKIGAERGFTEMVKYMTDDLTGYCNFITCGSENGLQRPRRIDGFNELEKKRLLIRAKQLVSNLQNVIDKINPELNAIDFDTAVNSFMVDYEAMKKATL